jgi:ribosomal protein L12E/L44/L45/RPP1/RPP2
MNGANAALVDRGGRGREEEEEKKEEEAEEERESEPCPCMVGRSALHPFS